MKPWVGPWGAAVTDDPTTKSIPPSAGSSVPPEPASFQLRPGDRVGNYVIREQIGEGGFAIVYAAEQEKPVRRKVALKIIKLGMDTKQVIARFEAAPGRGLGLFNTPWGRVMKRISHPRPVVSLVLATLLLLLVNFGNGWSQVQGRAVFAAEASEPTDPNNPVAAVKRRAIPVLPQADAQRVAELEAEIKTLQRQAKYGKAILRAEAILHLRQEHQTGWLDAEGRPAEWYEVGDARRAIETLRLLPSLSPDQRSELERADVAAGMVTRRIAEGRYGAALVLTRVQLPIRRRVLGDDHRDTLESISNMGYLLVIEGKLAEAEPYIREALERNRRVLGKDYPATLASMARMGELLRDQGKLTEAEPYDRDALEGLRRVLGDDHHYTLSLINNRGAILIAQHRLTEAELLLREALQGRRRVRGDEHLETLITIHNMGVLLQAQGKFTEAEPYYREALLGRRRVKGDEHPETLESISNVGEILHLQGRLAEAEPYLRWALKDCRRVLGDDHQYTLKSIHNMAAWFQVQGKLAEAEPLLREALQGRRRFWGDEHPETLVSISNLGALFATQGRLAEAEPLLREALRGQRRVLGDDHPYTLITFKNLSALYKVWGKPDKAAEWRAKLPTEQDAVASDPPAKQDE